MQMEYRGCVINLLDTPGQQDFSEDTQGVQYAEKDEVALG